MKDVTATEAARNFSALLDAIEHKKESFVVRRGGKAVARIGPASMSSGAELKKLLREGPPDPDWERDLTRVRGQLTAEERYWNA